MGWVPLGVVGLPPAGHRVADAGARPRVHVLHDDEGTLLQRGHGQVAVVRHFVQEAAVAGPDRVAHLEDPPGVGAHLERQDSHAVMVLHTPYLVSRQLGGSGGPFVLRSRKCQLERPLKSEFLLGKS